MLGESDDWREDSIKTRIETEIIANENTEQSKIEEKIPLKQGLKHVWWRENRKKLLYWREDSIKTRIETGCDRKAIECTIYIEEKIPLKQGLKHVRGISVRASNSIEEKIPLKQGLKPKSIMQPSKILPNWREDSIKTRIETWNFRDNKCSK